MKHFDEQIPADVAAVLDASAALEVTEFRLFELAWHRWFGQRPRPRRIEAHFAAYMFNERVPLWVRDFARLILDLDARGELDPRAFGIWQRLPSVRMRRLVKVWCAAFVVLFLVVTAATLNLDERILSLYRGCYFPPCYSTDQGAAIP